MTIKAVFENGVFRPTEAVSLPEGTTAEVLVQSGRNPPPRGMDPQEVAKFLAEIAALPSDGPEPDDGLSAARDHDKILYGGPKGAL